MGDGLSRDREKTIEEQLLLSRERFPNVTNVLNAYVHIESFFTIIIILLSKVDWQNTILLNAWTPWLP